MKVDLCVLRSAHGRQVAKHLRSVQQSSSDDEITRELIELISSESIAPAAFGQWLDIAQSPGTILAALAQHDSLKVRRLAIKKMGRLLSSPSWLSTWDALGGVQGLLGLLSDFSVHEVKHACKAFVCSVKTNSDKAVAEAKRKRYTELVQELLPHLFPDEANRLHANTDDRQLQAIYQRLIPLCTSEVVSTLLVRDPDSFPEFRRYLLLSHLDALQALALRYIFEDYQPGKNLLRPLLSISTVQRVTDRMHFPIMILSKLTVEDAKTQLPLNFAITELAIPLLKKTLKKKVETSFAQKVINLALLYLERHPDTVPTLNLEYGQFVQTVGIHWSREPDMFTKQFEKILSLPFYKPTREKFFQVMNVSALRDVAQDRRYALLLFYYQGLYNAELRKSDPKCKKISGLPPGFPTVQLPPEDSLDLFTRMRSIKDEEELIVRNIYASRNEIDVELEHAVLLSRCGRHAEAEEIARRGFVARKSATNASAKQEQRAQNARSAIEYAAASGSLQFFMEAQQWARRFVRDPLTARELYQSSPSETLKLLTGIWEVLHERTSFNDLCDRIKYANQIILFMFETVCLAAREPSFQRGHFHGVLVLPALIVSERKKWSRRLKNSIGFSDEEIYQIVWKNTLEMLLSIEEKGLATGYENLGLNSVRGILGGSFAGVCLADEGPSTYRFFDEFAKARDELWRRYRLLEFPAVTTLPDAFPRGLPVQFLIGPYVIPARDVHSYTPYIASRMKATVFPDPVAALTPIPADKEAQKAIGIFIDDYRFALRMMIPEFLDKKEKQSRVDQAWSYAIGLLSADRFTREEASRYWKKKDNKWISEFPIKLWPGVEITRPGPASWPLVPEYERIEEIEEWNPIPSRFSDIPARRLEEITCIDLSRRLKKPSMNETVRTEFYLPTLVLPGVVEPRIFSSTRVWQAKMNPAIREGQILSALLEIDSKIPNDGLLQTSFPPANRKDLSRYPRLYLDGELLESNADDPFGFDGSYDCLEAHLADVPSSLLKQLARKAISALVVSSNEDKGYPHLIRHCLKLATLLTQCDRPALASDLIVDMVMKQPNQSSWHRQLLSLHFLKRLPASAAQSLVTTFAEAVITTLEQQNSVKHTRRSDNIGDKETEDTHGSRSFVKVTTVKLLAQLLGETQCIPENFALSILTKLVVKASHVDIRRSAVNSLLSLYESTSSNQEDAIITALEAIIPIAGNIRERQPITDLDWQHAENTLELPELGNISTDLTSLEDTSPILLSLLSFLKMTPSSSDSVSRQALFVNRIILPIITSLKHQSAKWTSLFLRKNGFDFAAQQDLQIPQLPGEPIVYHEFLRQATPWLPLSFLEDFLSYYKFDIAPGTVITKFNERLKKDVTSKSNPAVKAWLARYARGLNSTGPWFNVASLLGSGFRNGTPVALTGEITIKDVQKAYLQLYTLTLLNDTETLSNVYRLQGILWNIPAGYTATKSWSELYQPLIEAIILYIETSRSRHWEKDPKRHPAVFPDTFGLHMLLLRYAAHQSDHVIHSEEHCASFAARVVKIINQISGGLYHKKFEELKSSVKYLLGDDQLRVACILGDISKTTLSWLTVQDHLRVELAASLLTPNSLKPRSDALLHRVNNLVKSWRSSESEEVRRLGFSCMIE